MKTHCIFKSLIWLSLITGLAFSCQKIELPGDNAETPEPEKPSTPQPETPEEGRDWWQVSEIINTMDVDNQIVVRGYIVGYIRGTQLSTAVFECPTNEPNTNMLLADSPDEKDYNKCLPVMLKKDDALAIRENLNLYNHPENLKRKIEIEGWLTTYFATKGIKTIDSYQWCNDEEEEEKPDEEEKDSIQTPGIDHTPTLIPEGR